MPKITDMQIQKNNKTRANIYVDGEYAFALEMVTVMKLGLKIGQDVSAAKLQQAIADSERSMALQRAIDYLSRASKTCKQMRDYLTRKGYTAQTVDYAIDRLKQLRYLDDDAYAQMYARQNSATKGSRRIRQELIGKGISVTRADEYSQMDGDQALNNASALAQKYMRGKTADVKTLQKLQRYLLYRGYGYDTVNVVIRTFGDVCDPD